MTFFINFILSDKALQNFHTLKIKEINKIIRELWQLIYKGQVRAVKYLYLQNMFFTEDNRCNKLI
jgi:hypothetical protein